MSTLLDDLNKIDAATAAKAAKETSFAHVPVEFEGIWSALRMIASRVDEMEAQSQKG